MNNESIALTTPVLFMVFNRLDTTKRVFDTIKKAKPARLYLASDGARSIKAGEKETVDQVRNYVVSNIDWDCEVKTLFREQNLGCGLAVSGAIDWLFENEESGIILEDDCVPSESFFPFADAMLENYIDDNSVGIIGGYNMFGDVTNDGIPYSAISMPVIWGWATWRRTWEMYKFDISNYSKIEIIEIINSVTNNVGTRRFFTKGIYETSIGKIDTWDFQLILKLFMYKKMVIVPNVNLIENIGFGSNATHTSDKNSALGQAKFGKLNPPYLFNGKLAINKSLVHLFEKEMYNLSFVMSFRMTIKEFALKFLKKIE
ncbi:MAG: hypothetical protein ACJASR_000092 [Psychroserpens sp.]|jgi:hypothetical protein